MFGVGDRQRKAFGEIGGRQFPQPAQQGVIGGIEIVGSQQGIKVGVVEAGVAVVAGLLDEVAHEPGVAEPINAAHHIAFRAECFAVVVVLEGGP